MVIVDPPKIEKPKEMPPLPVVYGVLALPSGTRAIMAKNKSEPGIPVHEGDAIGEFKIVALDTQNVTFEWDGKEIARKIDDLDRSFQPERYQRRAGERSGHLGTGILVTANTAAAKSAAEYNAGQQRSARTFGDRGGNRRTRAIAAGM